MRRLSVVALLLYITGCSSGVEPPTLDDTATMLNVFDPRADKQLIKGFYSDKVQGRWTSRVFSVILKPPPNAARKGAVLMLRFGLPGPSIHALHSIHLAAAVNGVALPPEEYVNEGEFDYVREVPASAFRGAGNATVDFTLDKALPPSDTEHRELGVVANTIGFEAK